MSKSSNNDKRSKAAPSKPQRVPTIKLNKRPDFLFKRSSALKDSYQDDTEGLIVTSKSLLGNLQDINPPKFKLYSIFDVII